MSNPYVPVLILAAFGLGFAVLSVGTSLVVGPKRYNRAKMEAYECGIQPTPRAEGGGRVPVKYFLTAMLFIIFDIEAVFLYPFAVAFDQLGLFALVEMVLFVVTVFVASAVGAAVGLVAGYYGRRLDATLMRVTDATLSFPIILLALILAVTVGPSFTNVVLAIGVVAWPSLARLVRGQFLTLREREFVQACRTMGMKDARIVFSEILPNALPPAIVMAAVIMAFSILLEAALAFLGVSDQNTVSWGWMIGQGREVIRTTPWLLAIPGIAIVITVLGVSLVGEGLNDALNPHRRSL